MRINAPLAPGVYLSTVPLTWGDGRLTLDGRGEVVDWLVLMRRLPAARLLATRLVANTVPEGAVRRLGERLVGFYATAARAPLLPADHRGRLRSDVAAHCGALAEAGAFAARRSEVADLAATLTGFVDSHGDLLAQRVREGRVVDGHGDLRPEHVWLLPVPVVIDRLEFDPALRQVDVADELAYLGMECGRLGGAWVGRELVAAWTRASGDAPPGELLAFHGALRATLRAKLALWHLGGSSPPEVEQRWLGLAGEYLTLATALSRGCVPAAAGH